jgi:hypothetical protein
VDVTADYEWIEERKPYREWLVPAEIVNRYPSSASRKASGRA